MCLNTTLSRENSGESRYCFYRGAIGFYLAIETAWFTYAEHAKPAAREGGLGMSVVFVIGPVCAVILGTGTTFLFGGQGAPQQIKTAAGLLGVLILVALVGSVIGF
jgi:hypothetical protein